MWSSAYTPTAHRLFAQRVDDDAHVDRAARDRRVHAVDEQANT